MPKIWFFQRWRPNSVATCHACVTLVITVNYAARWRSRKVFFAGCKRALNSVYAPKITSLYLQPFSSNDFFCALGSTNSDAIRISIRISLTRRGISLKASSWLIQHCSTQPKLDNLGTLWAIEFIFGREMHKGKALYDCEFHDNPPMQTGPNSLPTKNRSYSISPVILVRLIWNLVLRFSPGMEAGWKITLLKIILDDLRGVRGSRTKKPQNFKVVFWAFSGQKWI